MNRLFWTAPFRRRDVSVLDTPTVAGVSFHQRRSPEKVCRADEQVALGRPGDAEVLRRHREWGFESSERSGLVVLSDARLQLPESLTVVRGRRLRELVHDDWYMRGPRQICVEALTVVLPARPTADAILATLTGYRNYYHWIIEQLPRLSVVLDDPTLDGLRVAVPKNAPPFLFETLNRIGLGERLAPMPDGVWRFNRLYAPTRIAHAADVTAGQVAWICAALGVGTPARRDRRIFVSRRDAGSRWVASEETLAPALSRFGVETVVLTGMTVADQAALFAECELVVGPHGAGLANVVFCMPGATLLEIFPATYFNKAYGSLAAAKRLRYGFMTGPMKQGAIHVDVGALEALIGRVT